MKKIYEYYDLDKLAEVLKNTGGKVVLVGGCFDILHIGHVRFLGKAKEQGDILVVALESDEKTKKLKGEGRPINEQEIRAEILASLEMVDYVLKLAPNLVDNDYFELTKKIMPNVLAVSEEKEASSFLSASQPKNDKIRKIAEMLGIKYIKVMPLVKDISTSRLAKILGIE